MWYISFVLWANRKIYKMCLKCWLLMLMKSQHFKHICLDCSLIYGTWPARSPDLTPLHFFLFKGNCKGHCLLGYCNNTETEVLMCCLWTCYSESASNRTIEAVHKYLMFCWISASHSSVWPPLWSSGQSSWLQIRGHRVRFPALPKKVVGLEWGPLSLVSATEELLGNNSSGFGLERQEYGRRDLSRWQRGTLCPQKSWH
jgi:hypothetical protein